jgi:hypothetical protein
METSYYDLSVILFKKNLENLDALLMKAEAFGTEQGVAVSDMLAGRLATDMFPLVKQVQIATDNAKGACARLADVEAPVMDDTETTFAELHERIQATIAFLDTLQPAQFNGAGDRHVWVKYFPGKHFTGKDYLLEYAIPNFMFHMTTAYGIMRMQGVPLGKGDFIGRLTLLDDEVVA